MVHLPTTIGAPDVLTFHDLVARLREDAESPVPLLVFRLPELERTAWRKGLRAARSIERRATNVFASTAARVLRGEDLLAHESGSDVFVAALVARTRAGTESAAPIDARSALARMAATVESVTRLDVVTGWTTYAALTELSIEPSIEAALKRGEQERERYAFFSALGHELRTPLSSIRGYLETVLESELDPKTKQRFLRIAHNEALRLARLVDGMFEISLLDLHATFPTRSHAALHLSLEAASDAVAASAAARGVTIRCERIAPVWVGMDADRLTLVLINIFDNAIKHGRLGGRVAIEADLADARTVVVCVEDDGDGIRPEHRESIFSLGYRGDTRASGSGIGLALVRLMLERVGGNVEVGTSSLGGARFVLRFPRRDPSE